MALVLFSVHQEQLTTFLHHSGWAGEMRGRDKGREGEDEWYPVSVPVPRRRDLQHLPRTSSPSKRTNNGIVSYVKGRL